MAELQEGEELYAKALDKLFSDPETLRSLEVNPEETLERLGFELDAQAREIIRDPNSEVGVAALPAVLVKVATKGTRPVVSVAVRTTVAQAAQGSTTESDKE